MKRVLLAIVALALSAVPARAASFTIDSSNCGGDCGGLSWYLQIIDLGGNNYQAILQVTDDLSDGVDTNVVISAVDFKVSNSVTSATLYQAPTAGTWSTQVNVLSSGGCSGPNAGFVCSQSATDPAVFNGTMLTWGWYFTTTDPLFSSSLQGINLDGSHIGAKLTTLSTKGHLMSETYTAVPEPQSLAVLGLGALMFVAMRRRLLGLS